jgi:hypothetical protein
MNPIVEFFWKLVYLYLDRGTIEFFTVSETSTGRVDIFSFIVLVYILKKNTTFSEIFLTKSLKSLKRFLLRDNLPILMWWDLIVF